MTKDAFISLFAKLKHSPRKLETKSNIYRKYKVSVIP